MRSSKLVCLSVCTALTALGGTALADDTEVFFGNSTTATGPNILLILDTSGSMNTIDAGNTQSRATIVKNAVNNLLDNPSMANANVGLMRYSVNRKSTDTQVANDGYQAGGGMIVYPISPLSTNKAAIKTELSSWKFAGPTPLSETLYEAYRYFSGGAVLFGNSSYECQVDVNNGLCTDNKTITAPSISSSRTTADTSKYDSPMDTDSSCQKNYIVYLTDGDGNSDKEAVGLINSLTASTASDKCSVNSNPAETTNCLRDLAGYMHHVGSSTTTLRDLRTDVAGDQNVVTNFVGFGPDVVVGSTSEIAKAATAGGGKTYSATNPTSLDAAFQDFANQTVSDSEASFTSPSIAVNAFNKTQVLEDMYIALFKPTNTVHWNGNLKKYKLRNGTVVGRGSTRLAVSTTSAVDSSGFLDDNSKDFWELTTDTTLAFTERGGAAQVIPGSSAATPRKVYTYIGNNKPSPSFISLSSHPFNTTNSAITDTLLGITPTSCTSTMTTSVPTTSKPNTLATGSANPCKDNLIRWIRGDTDGLSSTTTDVRHIMGDPIHSQPSVVIYGVNGSTQMAKDNDAVVFVASNDGILHAIEVVDGTELWSYIPQENLADLKNLWVNATSSTKHYSLDGDIRILKYDENNNGKIDGTNDRVFLYFSQGRGGDNYYALDVTDKTNPKFMWSLGLSTLGSSAAFGVISKSWSTPTLARVNVGGLTTTQNPQKLVLIFGGGFDDAEGPPGTTPVGYKASDTNGNGVYMIDAVKGDLLWSASNSGANLNLTDMTHAIPSSVTVLDTDADGFTDRMYVGDLAGQVWRFDIYNGNNYNGTGTSALVTGGVIASLGEKGLATPVIGDLVNNRHFYSAPDVAKFIVPGGANYYNVAIGSGDRSFPKSNVTTADRFYSFRDYRLSAQPQSYYTGLTTIKDADLTATDGSSVITDLDGWKVVLTTKEKALAQAITVNGLVMFTTFIPGVVVANSCGPTTGSGRTYTATVATGKKYFADPNTADTADGNGFYEAFATTGLPSQVSIVNESNVIKTLEGETTTSTQATTTGTCMSGVKVLGQCVEWGTRVKTFWQESGAY
jgi:type IV pilus assembly protein PilY1